MPDAKSWLAYRHNHFQACRFGLQGHYVTAQGESVRLINHLRALFSQLQPVADRLGTGDMLRELEQESVDPGNGARWMRSCFNRSRSLPDMVEQMTYAFRGASRGPTSQLEGMERRRVRAMSEPNIDVQALVKPEDGQMPEHLH